MRIQLIKSYEAKTVFFTAVVVLQIYCPPNCTRDAYTTITRIRRLYKTENGTCVQYITNTQTFCKRSYIVHYENYTTN